MSECATCEFNCNVQQDCTTKANTEARSKSKSVNSELMIESVEVIAPVEVTPSVEQASVAAKAGKLAHTANNLNALLCTCKTSEDPPQVSEGTNVDETMFCVTVHPKENYRFLMPERNRLHAAVEKYRSQHNYSANINFANDISVSVATKIHIQDITAQLPQICQNSQGLGFSRIKSNSRVCRGGTISFDNHDKLLANTSSKWINHTTNMSKQLTRIQTFVNLDNVKSDVENMEYKVLKNTYNPKLLYSSNCICRDKYNNTIVSACSINFQSGMTSRENFKLSSSFEPNPGLISSFEGLHLKYFKTPNLLKYPSYSPKLGKIRTTRYYTNSIVSNENQECRNCLEQYISSAENNLYPPPLSSLQIFAISTKPLDIQVGPTKSVSSDINELPSLSIINYTENKQLQKRKLSILEPPPPGLVSRQESNENWNRFLIQLNSILENRIGEFV